MTSIWLFALLKIPAAGMVGAVWWLIRREQREEPLSSNDEDSGDGGGGGGPHRRPPLPRRPRRGPHGETPAPAPSRVRSAPLRARRVER